MSDFLKFIPPPHTHTQAVEPEGVPSTANKSWNFDLKKSPRSPIQQYKSWYSSLKILLYLKPTFIEIYLTKLYCEGFSRGHQSVE